jgi:hypothetical protein
MILGMKSIKFVPIALLTMVLSACVSNRITANLAADSTDSTTPSVMYPITADQADKIIVKSMVMQFGEVDLVSVAAPYKGYKVEVRWLLDKHSLTGRIVPAQGIRPDGSIADGYIFEVRDAGNHPTRGKEAARSLLEKMYSNADQVAKPLPLFGKPKRFSE